ncbi:DUF4065 domain-containing protein [Acinetobacter gerneri]|uniref:DUF4065 domain-containing protein n=1 Tax=Acinetobacter gerneri TaxID=202952 RepID=A0AAW8JI24_9GAMM|nr:type II toxin-antitoxin system antitoxin SocA domain-containing protein [Acinetobacter gerneri]MDQ9009051.1 DUF4065 domain-containing protein [Acinetobacter gerneri]MDQ9013155.1 DUF4065 domain-containing protein [Acinetobacter gerneri]MDQ9024592.1 DUF4065 domain-containing protein [Acinetobacter gerneri]MDQ9051827.1 DUF4065 domain-containing protein [Acinetobacter gerneri]MDQ9059192.1 DUF4065 domain-containing protein [Acinetobacter gerneri]
MAYSALQVANRIIEKGREKGLYFTQMQLLKLVYIAHGWYLAVSDAPLINNQVEAWKYGPVISDLYQVVKVFGSEQIKGDLINNPVAFSDDAETVMDFVIRNYGSFSAFKLSEITHAPNTPWSETFNQDGGWAEVITNGAIQKHYRELYKQYFN